MHHLALKAALVALPFAMYASALHAQALPAATSHAKEVIGGVGAAGTVAGAAVAAAVIDRENPAKAAHNAPEISTSGAVSGLVLLAGGMLIVHGRRRA